jgi:hypothetical protein
MTQPQVGGMVTGPTANSGPHAGICAGLLGNWQFYRDVAADA